MNNISKLLLECQAIPNEPVPTTGRPNPKPPTVIIPKK